MLIGVSGQIELLQRISYLNGARAEYLTSAFLAIIVLTADGQFICNTNNSVAIQPVTLGHVHIYVQLSKQRRMNTNYVVLILVLALGGASVYSSPLGKSRLKATHVNPEGGKFDLRKLLIWPNTYYDKPLHRYPYYDENGSGRLLYGYGGSDLYKYSVFKPLEGYFK